MNSQNRFIEAYLVELETALTGMPESKRQQVIAETRSHLESMVAAGQSEGLTEVAAWQRARSAFGEPRVIAKALLKASRSSKQVVTTENKSEVVRQGYLCIVFLAALYGGLQCLATFATSTLLLSVATLAWLPGLWAFQNWCNRQRSIVTTATQIRSMASSALVLLCLGLKLWFDAQPHGASLGLFSNLAFATAVVLACGFLLPWERLSQKSASL